MERIKFLDDIISKEGIVVDPMKVKAIKDWPYPTNVSEIRSFLGLAGYYRRFVEELFNLSIPLTMLTRKGVSLIGATNKRKVFRN